MATLEQCRTALEQLSDRFAANAAAGSKLDFDRSLACQITDLGAAFRGRLRDGRIHDLTEGDDPKAKIRLIVASDDLLALVAGTLAPMSAISSGRVKIKAGLMDMLKLQKLL